MTREPIAQESSLIKSMGYDEETFELEIEFKNGKVYRYEQVPEHIYHSLAMADSVGKAFTRLVKPVYKFKLVEEPKVKVLPAVELEALMKKDDLVKAIVEDRIQGVAEGRTSKWTRLPTPGFEIKPKVQS